MSNDINTANLAEATEALFQAVRLASTCSSLAQVTLFRMEQSVPDQAQLDKLKETFKSFMEKVKECESYFKNTPCLKEPVKPISYHEYQCGMNKLHSDLSLRAQELEAGLIAFQRTCKHEKTHYNQDPAGGSDSFYSCLICDKTL